MNITYVIHRTFHFRHASGIGTSFAIDSDGKQYLALPVMW